MQGTMSKLHHKVPQTYMRAWCFSGESVHTYDKETKKLLNRNISTILAENYFHSIKAGSLYTTPKALNKIFESLDQYTVKLNGNAFAIGQRTICVTDGLLNLSDEEIMAVFAHEVGHLAYQHSAIQLLIGGGNLFISGCLLIIKVICWIITALCGLITGIATRNFFAGVFATLAVSISAGLIWLWTKFCMLFLMWSMRQNEFVADEYAYKLGYGAMLASVLDRHMCSAPDNGLLKALYSTHPHSDDRIAHLQELGAEYSRY